MPTPSFSQNLVWFTNPLLVFLCAYFLYRRQDSQFFRSFFFYLTFVGTKTIVLAPLANLLGRGSYGYFYTSWTATMVSIGLSFLVLYEVVKNVLTSGTLKLSRTNVLLVASILFLTAVSLSFTFEAKADQPLMKIMLVATSLARFLQIGLLILLALLTLFFGFYWGDLAFGIALGFGFFASMDVIGIYFRGYLGPEVNKFYGLVDTWSYQLASLIWLFYILRKPKSPQISLPSDKVSEYTEPIEKLTK